MQAVNQEIMNKVTGSNMELSSFNNKEILQKLERKELSYKRGYVKTFRFLDMIDISQLSKMLFGHIESMMNLSNKNSTLYKDKEGNVFCNFTIKRIAKTLNCCEKTAVKLMKELEGAGLIIKVRQGNHKPNRIYLTDLSKHLIRENTSGIKEELQKNKNKKVRVKIQEIGQEQEIVSQKEKERLLADEIKKNIGYEVLIRNHNQEMIDGLYQIMLDVLNSNAKYFRVGGSNVEANKVKDAFQKLNQFHMEYVLDSLSSISQIKNVKNYLVTTLFNSLYSYGVYYSINARDML